MGKKVHTFFHVTVASTHYKNDWSYLLHDGNKISDYSKLFIYFHLSQ